MPVGLNYTYYPFATSQRDFPYLFLEKPSILVSTSSDLREKLLSLLEKMLKEGVFPHDLLKDSDESILVYYAIIDVLKTINDNRIINRVAYAYSKTAAEQLKNEKSDILILLAKKLGLNAEYVLKDAPEIPIVRIDMKKKSRKYIVEVARYQYAIPILQYLELASKRLIHDPLYSPINHPVWSGRIYLDKEVFIRVLEEHIYNTIIRQVMEAEPSSSSEYLELVEEVKSRIGEYMTKPSTRAVEYKEKLESMYVGEGRLVLVEELLPPCMKKMLESLKTGGNPSHAERFSFAAFLGQIGLDVDEILEYFKNTPDFNEKIARYQIEHILGLRGSKKKYMPHNCENLKSSGICPITEQCKGGKNPLAVYKYNLRVSLGRKHRKQTGKPSINEETSETSELNSEERAAGGI